MIEAQNNWNLWTNWGLIEKIFYSRAMKKDIQQKLECIGNIKLNQVSFILKEFLGGSSVVDKDQIDILEGLHLTESSGDDVIIDLRANNGKKPTYVWFLFVLFLLSFALFTK